MKVTLATVLMVVLLAGNSFAQQTDSMATKEDVETLLKLTRVDTRFQSIMEPLINRNVPELVRKAIQEQIPNATPEQLKQIDEFASKTVKEHFTNMPLKEALEAATPVIQSHYTHSEVQELIQFFSSPIGKKFIANEPKVYAETESQVSPILQKWADQRMAEVKKAAEEFVQSMKKKSAS